MTEKQQKGGDTASMIGQSQFVATSSEPIKVQASEQGWKLIKKAELHKKFEGLLPKSG